MNFLARLTLGQPAVCPKAIWTLTRAKSLCLCAFFLLENSLILRLLAFVCVLGPISESLKSAFVCVYARLFAFICACKHPFYFREKLKGNN